MQKSFFRLKAGNPSVTRIPTAMKKALINLCFLFPFCKAQAQQVDSVIVTDIYTSYVSFSLHEPLYVKYKLYKGGGACKRKGLSFKTAGFREGAKPKDYKGNGYDEGHLANAEDFAGDCKKENETFRFYNCLPQTPKLNRGIWKTWETDIRKESQTDSLLIFCGGAFDLRPQDGN